MKFPTDYVEALTAIFRHYIIVEYARKDPGELLVVSVGAIYTAWWWPAATCGGARHMGAGPEEIKLRCAPLAVAAVGAGNVGAADGAAIIIAHVAFYVAADAATCCCMVMALGCWLVLCA